MLPSPQIDSAFPGGNIKGGYIEGETVTLKPDLRDTEGHWFYWYFRVQGAAGRRLRFVFSGGLCLGARGPAISLDEGVTWSWLEASEIPDVEAFSYTFGPNENKVRFAFCLPYTLRNWKSFSQQQPSAFEKKILTKTNQGRQVPMVQIGVKSTKPLVVITVRHHCCETTGNYVLEGFLQAWNRAIGIGLTVIPFVDLDGVEAGDQGKNRRPHDHNRDYTGAGIYPETRAIRRLLEEHQGPFIVFDLHCPYARNNDSETVYLVGSAHPQMAGKQACFGEQLERTVRGFPYQRKNDIPFGTQWNVAENYHQGKSFTSWAAEQATCWLSTAIEIPYANAEGVAVTPESSRVFGASLSEAIQRYLSMCDLPEYDR